MLPPNFHLGNVLLDPMPPEWIGHENFRLLYGDEFDRLDQLDYTVSIKRSRSAETEFDLSFFGHTVFDDEVLESENSRYRGLILPSPGQRYYDAFETVYKAALEHLASRASSPDEGRSIEKLKYLGVHIFTVDEIMQL